MTHSRNSLQIPYTPYSCNSMTLPIIFWHKIADLDKNMVKKMSYKYSHNMHAAICIVDLILHLICWGFAGTNADNVKFAWLPAWIFGFLHDQLVFGWPLNHAHHYFIMLLFQSFSFLTLYPSLSWALIEIFLSCSIPSETKNWCMVWIHLSLPWKHVLSVINKSVTWCWCTKAVISVVTECPKAMCYQWIILSNIRFGRTGHSYDCPIWYWNTLEVKDF